jgi:Antitoxin VbhA
MPQFSKEEIARRIEALRLARASSAMEGLYELPQDAAALDAFARGEIDRAEFMRRVRVRDESGPTLGYDFGL